jgi:hypothetical protein
LSVVASSRLPTILFTGERLHLPRRPTGATALDLSCWLLPEAGSAERVLAGIAEPTVHDAADPLLALHALLADELAHEDGVAWCWWMKLT